MKKVKLPKGALRLVDAGKDCHALAIEKDGKQTMNMTIYSGKFIEGHWYWGKLGIELTGIKFDRSRYPVLENHWTGSKIGHMGKPLVNGGLKVNPENFEFVSTEESEKFRTTSKEGFPYQASMYAIPTRIERIERGSKAEVNGLTLHGPGTIWRECIFQEASVCVFGWDKKTEAAVFSKEETELDIEYIGEEEVMLEDLELDENENQLTQKEKEVKVVKLTLEQIQKDAPDLLAKIQKDAIADLTGTFAEERTGLEDQITTLKGQITTLTEENSGFAGRVDALEKKDAIRDQQALKDAADNIWNVKLAVSDLPEKRFAKIKNHVRFKDHLTEDGQLDKEKFAAAVDAEILEWQTDEGDEIAGGIGTSSRQFDEKTTNEKKLAEENKGRANSLLAIAGQEQKTE